MFEFLFSTWWRVLLFVVICLALWTLLSALLYRVFFKRFYDLLLSGLALVLLSPLLAAIALVTAVKLGRPVLFCQRRPGKGGRLFVLHKFRTMTDARDGTGTLLPDEARMTRYGRALRASSLDELPELWDIFRGKMSLVGPRPQLARDLVFMDERICRRHEVRPGLTGLAQVSGRNNIEWDERFACDLEYVERIGLFFDLKILGLTVLRVLKKSDVATDGMETSEDYGDWLLRRGELTSDEYAEGQERARRLLGERV